MSQIDDFLSGKTPASEPQTIDDFLGLSVKKKRVDVPEATAGSFARDIASGALQIGPTVVKGVADIARMATGDAIGKDTSEAMDRGMASIRDIVGSERAAAQRANFQADMADDDVGIGETLMRNKGALADQLLPTIGSMFLPVGVAGAAGKLATAGKAAQAMDKAALAARVVAVQKAAGIGTVAAQNAADTFAELVDKGTPMEDAYLAAGITVPFSVVAGKLTGGGAEGAITRALTGAGAAKAGIKQFGKAAGQEGAQEMGEELGQITGEAVGTGEAPSLMGAAKQMAVAGTLGAVMGGGVDAANQMGQFGRQGQAAPANPPAEPPVTPPAQPGTTGEGAGASQPTQAAPTTAADPVGRMAELELLAEQRDLTPVERQEAVDLLTTLNEQDAPQGTEPAAQAPEAAPVEAPAPEASDGAPAAGVPAEPAAAGVEAAGVEADQTLQPAEPPRPTDFWSFARSKGFTPSQIKIGTPEHAALKAEYDAVKAGPDPILPPMQQQPSVDLQNRDRGRAASVVQMSEIARNPDYMRLGPSRTPDSGAPMVFAVGDQLDAIPQDSFGRDDVAVMSDGQRVPFRYAVVDATKVNPSNFADGRSNPVFNVALPGTIKALNNGRTAGVRASHEMGTAQEYVKGMQADEGMHGIPADVIARTPNPMLVRVYSDVDNTSGMAAKSQGQGLDMSPEEYARQDAPLYDSTVLGVYAGGDVNTAANRDFVRAVIGKLQAAGQPVGGMMAANGELSPTGLRRIQAGLMQAAYGDADLVTEMFGSIDTDIKAIGEALKSVAGQWANMRDSARLGAINPETDITENLIQAIGLIRKARREGHALFDLVNQPDLMTGEPPNAMTVNALRLFYTGRFMTRPIGKERLTQHLTDYVQGAMSTSADAGMFGDVVSPADVLNVIIAPQTQGDTDAQTQPEESRGQPAGGIDPGRGTGEVGAATPRPGPGEGGNGTAQDRGGKRGQDAQGQAQQQVGPGNQGTDEGNGPAEGRTDAGQQEDSGKRTAATKGRARKAPGKTGAVKAKSITPDDAANLGRGDIVRDSKGVEYYAWSARFGRIDVMPLKDGKPVVYAGSAIRFALDDATRTANPEYRTDPLYLVSKVEQAQGAEAEPLLTAPTAEEIVSRQDAAETAKREKEAADRKADAEEKARQEREEIRRRSDAAADTFELGQDPMANLTGQQDIFGAPAEPEAPAVSANSIFTEDAAAKARARLKKKLGQLNSGIDPEMMMDGITLAGYHIEKGARTFAAYARAMLADLGDDVRPYLKSWYMGVKYDPRATSIKGLDDAATVEATDVEALSAQENQDVPSADTGVERDSEFATAEQAMGGAIQDEPGGTAAGDGKAGGQASRAAGRGQPDGDGFQAGSATPSGERSDFSVPGGNPAIVLADIATGAQFSERGSDGGLDGVRVDPVPAAQVDAVAKTGTQKLVAETKQKKVQPGNVIAGDLDNIRQTLPYLLPGQQEDVAKAEQQFAKPDGYGMLFTNGTGTGKTFTGLGVVKRFALQGKSNTLIVVPDDKIAADWIESGKALGLSITKLQDTKDAGNGIVVTSYANLGENDELARRQWDLVVPDEAHTLMQSADGTPTSYLKSLRAITLHPDGFYQRHSMLYRDDINKLRQLREQIDGNNKILNNLDTMDQMMASVRAENAKLDAEATKIADKLRETTEQVREEVKSSQGEKRPRAVFLSATPFAYEFTVDWANGYLFDYNEGQTSDQTEFRGYNQGSNRDRFFMQHFGYSMRYNKLTKPDPTKVDTGLLQRNFNGWLKTKGSLSGRMLDVKADYDRRFVLVESAIGNRIDEALNWLTEKSREIKGESGYSMLSGIIDDKFDYLSRRYLLEAIKATEAVPIVREHIRLGRKVVVFHDYKKGGGFNPFDIRVGDAKPDNENAAASIEMLRAAITEFRAEFKDLVEAPLGSLPSPIAVFKREFPDVLLINGDEKKSDLLARYKKFQDDDTPPTVMLVQSAKNKGWSGHDTTGKHQRVLINLGQPTAPTLAIQQEGRIYRTGQVSNAIMRYLNTGTNWEKWAFATTIATRASTAENLGMGELSRALKDSFIAAFEESDAYPPGHEGEGTGGKERDQAQNNTLTAYDRAKTYYWATQKKNSKTKAQEGVDYFATPEPVGMKMAEWLDLKGSESSLEPSAGHGAIARWLPETTKRTVVEPSQALRSRLAMAMNPGEDRIIAGQFEDLAVINKFDGIAMNPPFGVGGKTAVEHLAKAATHLRDGGRIVALIPTGPAADKRFDKWMYGTEMRAVKPLAEHPTLGPIYAGDKIKTKVRYAPEGEVVRVDKEGMVWVKLAPGSSSTTAVTLNNITSAEPTGKREREVRPAEGIYTVAEIRLPQVTFERAGTAVATRIVVLEKQMDAKNAPASGLANRDLTDITDIRELFDRLENMEMPKRLPTAEQQARADAEKAEQEAKAKREDAKARRDEPKTPKAANPAAVGTVERNGLELVEHVTKAGKTIKGIIRTDLTKEQAQKIDPYTWKKDGGFFIREQYLKNDGGNAAMSRSQPGAMSESTVRQVANTIAERWTQAPTIVVVPNMQDMRVPEAARLEDARQRAAGATGVPRGFYHRGTVYLVADGLKSVTDAAEALFHEALGHYGLRAVFGAGLVPILDQIAMARPDLMKPKAAEYGKDLTNQQHRREVAEEVLAVMAQTKPDLGFVKRAIAAIRTWLRNNVPAFKDMKLTDAEIINNFILPARGWVVRGEQARQANGKVAFLRAFHGSPYRFDKFSTDHMGKGEGGQSFGWGLYFAGKQEVAEYYRKTLSVTKYLSENQFDSDGRPNRVVQAAFQIDSGVANEDVLDGLEVLGHSKQEARQILIEAQKLFSDMDGTSGQLYEVNIPEETEYLLWDKPLSEQPDANLMREIAQEEDLPINYRKKALHGDRTGQDFYKALSQKLGSDEAASRVLKSYGVKGIKYLDGMSRANGEGGYNYVIFSGDDVAIQQTFFSRNGQSFPDIVAHFERYPYRPPSGMTNDEAKAYLRDRRASMDALVDAYVPRAEGLLLPVRGNGGFWGVTREARPDGDEWRVTRFDRNMEPQGHEAHRSARDAVADVLNWADPDRLDQGTMFSRSTLGTGQTPPPTNPWQKLKARAMDLTSPDKIASLIYEYQDKYIDLKNLREHIKQIGGTITDLNDAYLGEELYHKRLAKRTEDFLGEELKPLLADMRNRGVTLPQMEEYLHARHAPEANRVLAARNPTQAMIDAGKAKASADVKALEMQLQRAKTQGSATKAIEQALELAVEERERWNGAQAFKGTEEERTSLSGMSDDAAKAIMDGLAPGKRQHMEALAAKVDAINAKTLDTLEKYGLMDRAALDAWRNTYQHYVPLNRDEAHPDAVSHPIGQGFSTKGEAAKRRTGSNAKVTNILAHIAMQREAALTRGEKNNVAKKLYVMAAQNPDAEFWSVDKPPMIRTVDRETGFVRTGVDPTYKNRPNVVMVRVGGKDAAITFNERNPIAVRLAQSIKNADVGDLNAFESIVGKGTRWLASVNTQYNPVFGLINFARDVQAAMLQLSTTPIAGKQKEVASHVPAALKGIYSEVRSRRAGAGRGTGQWAQLWEEMQDAGGTTGYRELFTKPEERAEALIKAIDSLDRGQTVKAVHAVVDWLSDYNETMENAIRLSAYKVAIDQGISKERAASLAKNLTVNFNRRGRQTARLGAYYAFLNAAIQGTTRMVETMRGPLGKTILYGGVALGATSTLLAMTVMGGDGDDDEDNYEKIPDFIKERSIIIPLSKEDYIAIPMPLGYHVLPNIGRKAVSMMLESDPTVSKASHMLDFGRIVLDAFNPLGGSENLGQMAAPTVMDPVVALMQNRDWTGKQIYRADNNNLDPTPGHLRTKDTASTPSKLLAEALNKVTGGTDYQPGAISWTPDQIDYVVGQLTGGLGRELLKVNQVITAPLTGDDLPAHKIPVVGRVYGNTRGPANNAEKFYENARQLNMVENELRGRARDGGDVAGYMEEEPLTALVGMGNASENQLRKLRQVRREIVRQGLPGYQNDVRDINERMGDVMKGLNQEVKRVKQEARP